MALTVMASPDQAEIWIDQTGRVWRLEEMASSHRQNLIAWLRRQAMSLRDLVALEFTTFPLPNGDMATEAVMNDFDRMLSEDPIQWLESTPLYQRLVELESEKGNNRP